MLRHALLAILLLLSARSLTAQNIPSPYRYIEERHSLGAFAGYLWTDGGEIGVDSATVLQLGPRSAPLFGARYGLRFGGPASGEVALGFAPSERTVYARRDSTAASPVEERGTTDAPLLIAEAGVRFHLTGERTWNGLAPFAIATGGLVTDLGGEDEDVPELQRFDFGPAFAVGIGAGTDWFVGRRLSLRLEVHDRLWRITLPQGLRNPAENLDDERTEWSNNLGLSIGAAYHF